MQVIPSACDACEDNVYEVSNQCRGCVAKACVAACPTVSYTHLLRELLLEIAAIRQVLQSEEEQDEDYKK